MRVLNYFIILRTYNTNNLTYRNSLIQSNNALNHFTIILFCNIFFATCFFSILLISFILASKLINLLVINNKIKKIITLTKKYVCKIYYFKNKLYFYYNNWDYKVNNYIKYLIRFFLFSISLVSFILSNKLENREAI